MTPSNYPLLGDSCSRIGQRRLLQKPFEHASTKEKNARRFFARCRWLAWLGPQAVRAPQPWQKSRPSATEAPRGTQLTSPRLGIPSPERGGGKTRGQEQGRIDLRERSLPPINRPKVMSATRIRNLVCVSCEIRKKHDLGKIAALLHKVAEEGTHKARDDECRLILTRQSPKVHKFLAIRNPDPRATLRHFLR